MRRRSMVVVVVVGLGLAGCGGDDSGEIRNLAESESGTGPGATTSSTTAPAAAACTVEGGLSTQGKDLIVTLDEYTVEAAAGTVAPGIVSFIAENIGAEAHELVIVRTDDPETLPTGEAGGGLDEDRLPEGAIVGEIEAFAPGQLCRGNFALPAGTYALICREHLGEGMVTVLSVA